ncbi:MAG: hypothetical protein WAL30_04820 [Candidatus Aquirickettsiella sp.]
MLKFYFEKGAFDKAYIKNLETELKQLGAQFAPLFLQLKKCRLNDVGINEERIARLLKKRTEDLDNHQKIEASKLDFCDAKFTLLLDLLERSIPLSNLSNLFNSPNLSGKFIFSLVLILEIPSNLHYSKDDVDKNQKIKSFLGASEDETDLPFQYILLLQTAVILALFDDKIITKDEVATLFIVNVYQLIQLGFSIENFYSCKCALYSENCGHENNFKKKLLETFSKKIDETKATLILELFKRRLPYSGAVSEDVAQSESNWQCFSVKQIKANCHEDNGEKNFEKDRIKSFLKEKLNDQLEDDIDRANSFLQFNIIQSLIKTKLFCAYVNKETDEKEDEEVKRYKVQLERLPVLVTHADEHLTSQEVTSESSNRISSELEDSIFLDQKSQELILSNIPKDKKDFLNIISSFPELISLTLEKNDALKDVNFKQKLFNLITGNNENILQEIENINEKEKNSTNYAMFITKISVFSTEIQEFVKMNALTLREKITFFSNEIQELNLQNNQEKVREKIAFFFVKMQELTDDIFVKDNEVKNKIAAILTQIQILIRHSTKDDEFREKIAKEIKKIKADIEKNNGLASNKPWLDEINPKLKKFIFELFIDEDRVIKQEYYNYLFNTLSADFFNSFEKLTQNKGIIKYIRKFLPKTLNETIETHVDLSLFQKIERHIKKEVSRKNISMLIPMMKELANFSTNYSELFKLREKLDSFTLYAVKISYESSNLRIKIPYYKKETNGNILYFKLKHNESIKNLFDFVMNYKMKNTVCNNLEEGVSLKKIITGHLKKEEHLSIDKEIDLYTELLNKITTSTNKLNHKQSQNAASSVTKDIKLRQLKECIDEVTNCVIQSKLKKTDEKFLPVTQKKDSIMEDKSHFDCFLARLLSDQIEQAKNELKALNDEFSNYMLFERKFNALKALLNHLRQRHLEILKQFDKKSVSSQLIPGDQQACILLLQLSARHTLANSASEQNFRIISFLKTRKMEGKAANYLKKYQIKLDESLTADKNKRSEIFGKLKKHILEQNRIYLDKALMIICQLENNYNSIDFLYKLIAYVGTSSRIIIYKDYLGVQDLNVEEKKLLLGMGLEICGSFLQQKTSSFISEAAFKQKISVDESQTQLRIYAKNSPKNFDSSQPKTDENIVHHETSKQPLSYLFNNPDKRSSTLNQPLTNNSFLYS